MNKKYLILTSLACLAVTGVTATAIAAVKGGFNTLGVKATAKQFTFDSKTSQFSTTSDFVEKSVITGVSDNLETTISLKENGTECNKVFCDNNGYFMRNGTTVGYPKFKMTIGVNNATSVRVICGVEDVDATYLQCAFHLKNGSGEDVFAPVHTLTEPEDDLTQGDFSWTLETADQIKEVEIDIECDHSIYFGTPLFIKSITLGWSC